MKTKYILTLISGILLSNAALADETMNYSSSEQSYVSIEDNNGFSKNLTCNFNEEGTKIGKKEVSSCETDSSSLKNVDVKYAVKIYQQLVGSDKDSSLILKKEITVTDKDKSSINIDNKIKDLAEAKESKVNNKYNYSLDFKQINKNIQIEINQKILSDSKNQEWKKTEIQSLEKNNIVISSAPYEIQGKQYKTVYEINKG